MSFYLKTYKTDDTSIGLKWFFFAGKREEHLIGIETNASL